MAVVDDTAPQRSRSRVVAWRKWARIVHAYSSMVALVLVLFFGLTGITLNHPQWTFGDEADTTTSSGTFAFDVDSSGSVDFLAISEFIRSKYGVTAPVSDHLVSGDKGTLSYRNPGYSADVSFSVSKGTYDVTVDQQGWVAVLNDLHKGRDAGSAWKWTIDVAAGVLVLIAASGLVLQLVVKLRRRSAVVVAAVGAVVSIVLVALTL